MEKCHICQKDAADDVGCTKCGKYTCRRHRVGCDSCWDMFCTNHGRKCGGAWYCTYHADKHGK